MSRDWAEKTAQGLVEQDAIRQGLCLVLGASDTGKTTLAFNLAKRLTQNHRVAIVDADIGQSHVGPPTTVGWTTINSTQCNLKELQPHGISFVGHMTPVGHLLQLTAAIVRCVEQARTNSDLVIIDTPGLVVGHAAAVLWWTVHKILRPEMILAVQKETELNDIIEGLAPATSQLKVLKSPSDISAKSPQQRLAYRQRQFARYFKDSHSITLDLTKIAIQTTQPINPDRLRGKLLALRDEKTADIAIAFVESWNPDTKTVIIKVPKLDINKVCCIVLGDVIVEMP
jgi:polynucleotide 5'-hydroxyl-kinase GRC3/NOL9